MAYKKAEKKPGDLMESKDWNALSAEVERLGSTKMNRSGDNLSGKLLVNESIDFGEVNRQMLNFWGSESGIGIQENTQYFRSSKDFAWYQRGQHNNDELDAGGGKTLMVIKDSNVGIGTTDPKARLHVANRSDVTGKTISGDVMIGDPKGPHLSLDCNEIMAKSKADAVGTLNLNTDGGKVLIGGLGKTDLEVNGNLEYDGQQKKLDVGDTFSAIIRCADLKIGHSTRHHTAGRALVDKTDVLSINHDKDWPKGVQIHGNLYVTGQITSGQSNIVMGYQTQQQAISSKSWTALPDCKATITTQGGKVLILASLDPQAIGGRDSWGEFTIFRGNTDLKPSGKASLAIMTGHNQWSQCMNLQWLDSPPAGTHQYQIYGRRGGATAIDVGQHCPASIIVQEMI